MRRARLEPQSLVPALVEEPLWSILAAEATPSRQLTYNILRPSRDNRQHLPCRTVKIDYGGLDCTTETRSRKSR